MSRLMQKAVSTVRQNRVAGLPVAILARTAKQVLIGKKPRMFQPVSDQVLLRRKA